MWNVLRLFLPGILIIISVTVYRFLKIQFDWSLLLRNELLNIDVCVGINCDVFSFMINLANLVLLDYFWPYARRLSRMLLLEKGEHAILICF